MAQTIQSNQAASGPAHAPASTRNNLRKPPDHWYITRGLDSGRLPKKIVDFNFLIIQLAANNEYWQEKQLNHSNFLKLKRQTNPISLLAHILETTTLVQDGNLVADMFVNNSHLKEFSELCKNNQILIEESLKIELRDDLKINPIRQLNSFLKLVGLRLNERKRLKRKGKNVRSYGIDPVSLKLMQDLSLKFVSRDSLKSSTRT